MNVKQAWKMQEDRKKRECSCTNAKKTGVVSLGCGEAPPFCLANISAVTSLSRYLYHLHVL